MTALVQGPEIPCPPAAIHRTYHGHRHFHPRPARRHLVHHAAAPPVVHHCHLLLTQGFDFNPMDLPALHQELGARWGLSPAAPSGYSGPMGGWSLDWPGGPEGPEGFVPGPTGGPGGGGGFPPPGQVPEPATWVTMLVGLGAVGTMARIRRSIQKVDWGIYTVGASFHPTLHRYYRWSGTEHNTWWVEPV